MENLFEASRLEEVKRRLRHLQPDSKREWGQMTPAQMLAHCSVSIEVTMGQIRPPRMLIGRIIGPAIKRVALREGEPMRRNSPTALVFLVKDDRNFATERQVERIDRSVRRRWAGLLYRPSAQFLRAAHAG